MRTPSRVDTGYFEAKCLAARCTISNLRSSAQHSRARHVEDHRVARTHAARQVAAEQHEQLIAEHGATPIVYRADAVAVAVEGDPQLAAIAADGRLQVAQVLQRRRIRMMIG